MYPFNTFSRVLTSLSYPINNLFILSTRSINRNTNTGYVIIDVFGGGGSSDGATTGSGLGCPPGKLDERDIYPLGVCLTVSGTNNNQVVRRYQIFSADVTSSKITSEYKLFFYVSVSVPDFVTSTL